MNGGPPAKRAGRCRPIAISSTIARGEREGQFMQILNAIFNFLYETILGCSHQHLTRPFTLEHETYKVCLDCGKRVFYSAANMRQLTVLEVRRMNTAAAGEVRVMPAIAAGPRLVPASARKSNAA